MSGDRANPVRRIHLELGQVAQLQSPVAPAQRAAQARNLAKSFGLLADARLEPTANGSRLAVEQVAVANAELAVEVSTLRELIPSIPSELIGRIEVGLARLSGSGEVEMTSAEAGQISGDLTFSKFYLRAPGGPQLSASVQSVSGIAKVNSPFKSGPLGPASTLSSITS